MPTPDIHSLQAGDEAAWNLAFEVLWPDAFHVAHRRLSALSPADAEDAAVMAIRDAAAWVGRLGSFEELRALVRWMAHRRAIDMHRSLQAARRGAGKAACGSGPEAPGNQSPGDNPGCQELPHPGPEPWEQADALELAVWLAEVAHGLTTTEQALLIGHYHEGKTHGELAADLAMERSTVGIRIHRALAKVRRLLAARPRLFQELHARCRPS